MNQANVYKYKESVMSYVLQIFYFTYYYEVKQKLDEQVENRLNCDFHNQPKHHVVVCDLTYVRVGNVWNYICVLIDLFNREIIGYSAGKNKDASLCHASIFEGKSEFKTNVTFPYGARK